MTVLGEIVSKHREYCADLSLQQLTPLFAEFQGATGHELRFDTMEVHRLRTKVCRLIGTFVRHANVEPVPDALRMLADRPGVHGRRAVFAGERSRLEAAGLSFPTEE